MDKEPVIKGQIRRPRFSDEKFNNENPNPIYKWWWEFMRLSPVFWYSKTSGIPIKNKRMNEVFSLLNDSEIDHFGQWWKKYSVNAFGETVRLPKVAVLDTKKIHRHIFKPNALYLEIPLNMSKAKISRSIHKEIKKYHSGRSFDVAKTTTANLKIYTWRYRLKTIENEYWILLYSLIYEKINIWQIGDRLKISPALNLRNLKRAEHQILFNRMNSLVGRYLYKAKFTLDNAEYGNFPNPNKPSIYDDKPFGEKEHSKYIKATEGEESQYKHWLRNKFKATLHQYIIDKNRLHRQMSLSDSITRKRFLDFVSGKTEFLNEEKFKGPINIRNSTGDF